MVRTLKHKGPEYLVSQVEDPHSVREDRQLLDIIDTQGKGLVRLKAD